MLTEQERDDVERDISSARRRLNAAAKALRALRRGEGLGVRPADDMVSELHHALFAAASYAQRARDTVEPCHQARLAQRTREEAAAEEARRQRAADRA